MKNKLLLLIFLFVIPLAFSQTEQSDQSSDYTSTNEKKIRLVLENLFNGMRDSDSALVRSLFHEDATLKSTYFYEKLDKARIIEDDLEDFIIAIGTPKEEIWNEKIANVVILQDDFFAQVWMDYEFYVDDTFSHCGVNSIQMVITQSGWKIIDITDTRRKSACNVDSND